MKSLEDLFPVLSILLVILVMTGVNILLIGDPERSLTSIPLLAVLGLWLVATLRLRRSGDVR